VGSLPSDPTIKFLNYKVLELYLNGSNNVTKPVLDNFKNEIDHLFLASRSENSARIKLFNKNSLNKIWEDNFSVRFFNPNNQNDMNIGQSFNAALIQLETTYNVKCFYGIQSEKNESFREWREEKDIDSQIKYFNNLSKQIKAKIENDNIIERKRVEKKRLKIELKNQLRKAKADADAKALVEREAIAKAKREEE
jgi:hypothetical protein